MALRTKNLILPVTYDDEKTDIGSVADAVDIIIKTAMSTPGVLDSCGDPGVEVGETAVQQCSKSITGSTLPANASLKRASPSSPASSGTSYEKQCPATCPRRSFTSSEMCCSTMNALRSRSTMASSNP